MKMPAGLDHVRTTAIFDAANVPAGLLRAHRVADGVWGRLVVHSGVVTFVFEDESAEHVVVAGDTFDIPPGRPHHVMLEDPTTFAVEFHKAGS